MASKKVESESDSDLYDDQLASNVCNTPISPPFYIGPCRKGHLIFNANFDSGNLAHVECLSEWEYDLFIRHDTLNERFRVWFNFTVENFKPNQRVIFNVVNFSKSKSLYREGMTPVVKSASCPTWLRIPEKNVVYYKSPTHTRNYVMSFAFCFEKKEEFKSGINKDGFKSELNDDSSQDNSYDISEPTKNETEEQSTTPNKTSPENNRIFQFAYCYPYTFTFLQNYLDAMEMRRMPYFHRGVLAITSQKRRLDLLTITSNLKREEKNMRKPHQNTHNNNGNNINHNDKNDNYNNNNTNIFINSNINNNNSNEKNNNNNNNNKNDNTNNNNNNNTKENTRPTTHEKRLVFITSRVHPGETPSSFVCQGLIDFMTSKNPIARRLREGVVFKVVPMLNPDGVYNGNYRCSDLGHDLNRHWLEPSPWCQCAVYAVKNLLLRLDQSDHLDFYIDLHAHSTLMNGFMYGNAYEDTERQSSMTILPQCLRLNAPDFSLSNTNFNNDPAKTGTGRKTLGDILSERCHCYTLEVSFSSYRLPNVPNAIPYTPESYLKLGQNLAKAFFDYYYSTGVITVTEEPERHCFLKIKTGTKKSDNLPEKPPLKASNGKLCAKSDLKAYPSKLYVRSCNDLDQLGKNDGSVEKGFVVSMKNINKDESLGRNNNY